MTFSHRVFSTLIVPTIAILMTIIITKTGAFNSKIPRLVQDLSGMTQQKTTSGSSLNFHSYHNDKYGDHRQRDISRRGRRDVSMSMGWLKDALNYLGFDFEKEKEQFGDQLQKNQGDDNEKGEKKTGTVIRTAVKNFHPSDSKPNSPNYTTAKNSQSVIHLTPQGVDGDYNHYRTIALDNTLDRAVSILTTDVMEQLRNVAGYTKVNIGDLGENIYVDGITFDYFQVGKRYQFGDDDGTQIEITERIEPCGNLCKLPFINDASLNPMERINTCKNFLLFLDQRDGIRGWYGKVISGNQVKVGDRVVAI